MRKTNPTPYSDNPFYNRGAVLIDRICRSLALIGLAMFILAQGLRALAGL